MGFLRRAFRIGGKLAVVAAVAGFILWRVRFAPVPVESFPAASGSIVAETMGTGTLEARVQAIISAEIPGRITKMLVDQGDRVATGQLLVALDDGDMRQQVEMAKADRAAARAGVDRAAADIASAQATVVQTRADTDRNGLLRKSGTISEQELEKSTERRDVAEADLRRTQLARIEIERQVDKADETLRYYESRLTDTRIAAPFDGLVIRRRHEQGDVVVPGSAILEIISTEQMWVSAWVDESAMASLAVGQPARILFRAEPEKARAGVVARIAPLTDRETREFLVDVAVKDLPRVWAVGQRAEVYIETARQEQALLAPQSAIVWQKGKPGLFVSDGGHAAWRSVELGLRGDRMVQVLTGLSVGDIIIWPRDAKDAALTAGRAVSLP